MVEILAPRRNSGVLDIACGTGEWLRLLNQKHCQISGIDISSTAIEICQRDIPNGDFRVGVAEKLPYKDQSFELVTCMGSLEHFLDQPKALAEMVRVAKRRAEILILVPNAGFPLYRFGLYRGTQQTHIRETVRPLAEWSEMMEAAGMKVLEQYKDLHILSSDWILRNGLAWIPARLVVALLLLIWPLGWQYQVYFRCRLKPEIA